MSNKKVSVDNLSKEIMKALTEYKDDVEDDVIEETDAIIKEAKAELQLISPKNRPEYAGSWTVGAGTKGNHQYTKVVHNKKHYRLTHLLEFGHATKNGGRTKAMPHIRPTEDKYGEKLLVGLEQRTRR